jgi:pSer/pThr/pTyr-binding forkhead associated (FHA) protein
VHDEGGETTMSLTPDDVNDDDPEALDVTIEGTALVVRVGGGIEGQTFTPTGPRTLIGRAPDCDVFLDDVTVSRRHAELLHDGDRFTIRDLGSLNGTFVNRQRVEAAELHDDDEVQIGKYRMTFLQR